MAVSGVRSSWEMIARKRASRVAGRDTAVVGPEGRVTGSTRTGSDGG
jgi:hypothetical protein